MINKILNKLRVQFTALRFSKIEYARKLGVNVGKDCRIFTRNFGSEPWLISIGDRVTITSSVKILTHDGATWLIRDEKGRRYSFKRTVIGNDVFVGINSVIMPGVVIGNKVIVAAGSIVTKSVPSGSIIGGNPARIIGNYNDYEKKALRDFVSDSDLNYSLEYKERINSVVDPNQKSSL